MIAACCIFHNICIENGEPDPKIGDSHDNYDNNDDFVDGGASSNADAVKDVFLRNLLNCKQKMLYWLLFMSILLCDGDKCLHLVWLAFVIFTASLKYVKIKGEPFSSSVIKSSTTWSIVH